MQILSMMQSHMGTLWVYTGYPSLTDIGIE